MKINNFVSNSSSCSFILFFKSPPTEKEILHAYRRFKNKEENGCLSWRMIEKLAKDIKEANPIPVDIFMEDETRGYFYPYGRLFPNEFEHDFRYWVDDINSYGDEIEKLNEYSSTRLKQIIRAKKILDSYTAIYELVYDDHTCELDSSLHNYWDGPAKNIWFHGPMKIIAINCH
jgi:hypothetical protein